MVKIEWTDEAVFWLKEIHDYMVTEQAVAYRMKRV
jgi:hypothetical protein